MAELTHFLFSLRFKFALLLALFGGALMLAITVLLGQQMRQTLIQENIDKGLGIARGIAFNAEDPLLTGDDLYLFSAVKNARKSPGVEYALVVDHQGQIRAADDTSRVGSSFALGPNARSLAADPDYRVVRITQGQAHLLDLEVPIFSVAENPVLLGQIHLGLSEELINQQIARMRQRLMLLASAALAVGCLLAFLLASFFVRPINALVRGVKAIGEGQINQHINLKRSDELGVLTTAFNQMAVSLQEKEYLRNTFERYVSKPLAEEILKHKDELTLGGEEKEVSILFSDIRRFTGLAEKLPPTEVVSLLNEYFTRMIRVVSESNGMVDKLMGDSVMALFGAPVSLGDDPVRAVRCALAMQREVEAFNRHQQSRGLPALAMGIGINTGSVVAGNIGSSTKMEYTVIGDNVNVAARLQGIASPGEVLISGATYDKVAPWVRATPMEPMILKGKQHPVNVYRVDSLVKRSEAPGNPE